MNLRFCKNCSKHKDPIEFSKNRTRGDGLQIYCKICASEIATKWHHENKNRPEVAKRMKDRDKRIGNEFKLAIDQHKRQAGCKFCFENEPCCLDFHHLGNKDKDVSYLRRAKSPKVWEEIKKCIVVCSNCHRKIHAGKIVCEVSKH